LAQVEQRPIRVESYQRAKKAYSAALETYTRAGGATSHMTEEHTPAHPDRFDDALRKAYYDSDSARRAFDTICRECGAAEAVERVRANPVVLGALRPDEVRGWRQYVTTPGHESARIAAREAAAQGAAIWKAREAWEHAEGSFRGAARDLGATPLPHEVGRAIQRLPTAEREQLRVALEGPGAALLLRTAQDVQAEAEKLDRQRVQRGRGYGRGL
jgi:hypothetical protein